ncbi:hypothetical protein Tco_1454604 [Tanacetum coccineum]
MCRTNGDIRHQCSPLRFKIRTAEWPTCNWKQDRYCKIEDSEVREEALNNKRILEESMNGKEESSDDERSLDSPIDEWEDYEPDADIEADDNSNYNPYLDISQLFNDHTRKNEEDIGQDRIELNNHEDDDMGYIEDHLVYENEPFTINKKEEGFNEQRCKPFGISFKTADVQN